MVCGKLHFFSHTVQITLQDWTLWLTESIGWNSWSGLRRQSANGVMIGIKHSSNIPPWMAVPTHILNKHPTRTFSVWTSCKVDCHIWVFPKIGVPQNGWFIMEKHIKMDNLGVPLFSETSIYSSNDPAARLVGPPKKPLTERLKTLWQNEKPWRLAIGEWDFGHGFWMFTMKLQGKTDVLKTSSWVLAKEIASQGYWRLRGREGTYLYCSKPATSLKSQKYKLILDWEKSKKVAPKKMLEWNIVQIKE